MTRIIIKDLPQDMLISREEMKKVLGGITLGTQQGTIDAWNDQVKDVSAGGAIDDWNLTQPGGIRLGKHYDQHLIKIE